jgi:hypothetical protein
MYILELRNTVKQNFHMAISIYHPTNNALDSSYSLTLWTIDILFSLGVLFALAMVMCMSGVSLWF